MKQDDPQDALLQAIWKDDVKAARQAIDQGADPNAMVAATHAGTAGAEPLKWPLLTAALMLDKTEVARELWRRGADINARDNLGRTALLWLCSLGANSEDTLSRVQMALEWGGDVNARDGHGTTALDAAAGTLDLAAAHGPGAAPGYRQDMPLAIIDLLRAAGAQAGKVTTEEKIRAARRHPQRPGDERAR